MGKSTRRVAFITGASRGIGAASARALAEAGFDVVVTARSVQGGEYFEYSPTARQSQRRSLPGNLQETAAAVREHGQQALVQRLDLMEIDSLHAAVEAALGQWGQIDLLLNNAIYQGPGLMDPLLEVPAASFETILRCNVVAQLELTQRVLPGMLARGQGTIVNMTSGSAEMDPPAPAGQGGWGFAYGASKGAFHRMAGVLHVEHAAAGIRAFNLEPGNVRTESRDALAGAGAEEIEERFPSAPPAVPAAVVAWLATHPDADAFLGQTVRAQSLCRKRGLLPGWPV